MKRFMTVIGVAIVVASAFAWAQVPIDKVAEGKKAFLDVARVLQSPRCVNCHPVGDRPMQGDAGKAHTQNISRRTVAAGVLCTTCHQTKNSEEIGIAGGPPGAPNWGLPPIDTPMVFQGKTANALCLQLNDIKQTNGKDLEALVEHVSHDKLVLWGWSPGGNRTLPPLTHEQFVKAFRTWVDSGAACP